MDQRAYEAFSNSSAKPISRTIIEINRQIGNLPELRRPNPGAMQSLTTLSDEELIEEIKASGNQAGFRIIYERYGHLILGWCMRYLKQQAASEDATMDIMEQLMLNLNRYEIKNFKNWLFLLTRNHCFQKLKGKTAVLMDDLSQIDGEENMESGQDDPLKTERIEEALHEQIENLNEHQKNCIVLFYLKKKSYKEIVDLTGYEMTKVKSHIQNGKRNLRLTLEDVYKEE